MPRNPSIPYNPKLKERARELRKNPTFAEKILWQGLRRKQLGYEFHRQVPIDEFILDFYCNELMLAIEIDGVSHDDIYVKVYDENRQARIEGFGVSFLRFMDDTVKENVEKVLKEIRKWIEEHRH